MVLRWWFQIFFIFAPIWEDSHFDSYFLNHNLNILQLVDIDVDWAEEFLDSGVRPESQDRKAGVGESVQNN